MEEPERKRAPGDAVRKLSPCQTRSLGPEQRKPLVSPPPPCAPRWLILDRFVHRSSRHRGVIPDDATASALAHDCFGRPIRASLRIADPPAVSRLYLHLQGRPPIKRFQEPMAIAAHRNSILFRLTVPFEDPDWWHDTVSFPDDYFVYSCRSSSPPSLTRLPTCFEGGTICPELDKLYKPHRRQQQRAMFEEEIGILSHDDEREFTVAQLNFSGPDEFDLCVLHHPPHASVTSMEWMVKKVKNPPSMEWMVKKVKNPPNMKINAYSWRTDSVVPLGRSLCWVDNYQGLLIIDVLDMLNIDVLADSKKSTLYHPHFHYIPLPCMAMSRRKYMDGGSLDPLRCVCVTDAGIIKLVCILTKCPPSPYPFTIKTWTLNLNQDLKHRSSWTMDTDVTMGAEEFFHVLGAGRCCLPPVQPRFPLVSLDDPDVIYFLLDDMDRGLFWMIEVNMRKKQLQSSTIYMSELEEAGYPHKRGRRYNFFGHQFIPSKFSSYLAEDAITSRKLSEEMQKAKEERVLQKRRECCRRVDLEHN